MLSESASFHSAIFDALCACLDLDRDFPEAVTLIHEAYAEPENVSVFPSWKSKVIVNVFVTVLSFAQCA